MPRNSSPDADAVLRIQKYPNRRLYDRTTSRHLTHEELRDLVVAGRTIEVVDSRSGEDITNLVLAQVLLEHAPARLRVFPPELLHVLIRANQRLLPGLQQALLPSFASAIRGWQAWQRQMADLMVGAAPSDPFAWMLSALPRVPLLDEAVSSASELGDSGDSGQTTPGGTGEPRELRGGRAAGVSDHEGLEERLEAAIESLERQLASLRSPGSEAQLPGATRGASGRRGRTATASGDSLPRAKRESSASARKSAEKPSTSRTDETRAESPKRRRTGTAQGARKPGKTR